MKLSRTPLLAGLAALGVAASTLPLSGCKADASSSAAPAQAAAPGLPTVTLATPRAVQTAPHEEVTGTLFPAQALQVGFEVGGRLEKVRVKKGENVQQGQVLAWLNAEISDAQVAQAEAALVAAEAGAAMAADVAERNAKLQEQGNVSDLQNRTVSTQARQAQAQAARRRHELKAPFAGTLIDAPEQTGATVGPGMPLFSLENLGTLLLKTTVSESARAGLKVGAKVRVESIGGSASTDEAVIRTILPSADPATRRIPVDIAVPNADGRFVAHTLARAVLPLGEQQEAQVIPATALASSGGDHVWVVAGSGEVRRVDVQVLERGAREVVVKAATRLDKVIEYSTPALAEGTRVSVK